MVWNPSAYLRHSSPRLRPALDLLSQAASAITQPLDNIKTVLDLGCGPGNITKYIAQTFPKAYITGIDSSPEMIYRANELHNSKSDIYNRLAFRLQSMEDIISNSETKYDVVYSNAALHWLPDLDVVLPKMLQNLLCKNEGGILALQIPDTKNQLSHLLMEKAALGSGNIEKIYGVRIPRADLDASQYFQLLTPHCKEINMWSTEYIQQLPYRTDDQYHPVLQFTKSTGLTPMLDAIGGENSIAGKRYLDEYNSLLFEYYPVTNTNSHYTHGSNIIFFPFRRLFMICRI